MKEVDAVITQVQASTAEGTDVWTEMVLCCLSKVVLYSLKCKESALAHVTTYIGHGLVIR